MNIWNQVFEKAGVPCPKGRCFFLDEIKVVPLGDIRYNVFNFIDPEEGGSLKVEWSGYGPSLANHETGEVISATTNVHTLQLHRAATDYIYNYIQKETGLAVPFFDEGIRRKTVFERKEILSLEGVGLPNVFFPLLNINSEYFENYGHPATADKGFKKIYGFRQTHETHEKGLAPVPLTSLKEAIGSEEKERELLFSRYRLITGGKKPPKDFNEVYRVLEEYKEEHEGIFNSCLLQEGKTTELAGDRIYSLIGALCGEDLSVISRLKKKGSADKAPSPHEKIFLLEEQTKMNEMVEEIKNCADKILPLFALGVTIHEQGHNINMRHNFAGSADKKNFLKNEDFSHDYIFSHLTEEEEQRSSEYIATPQLNNHGLSACR